MSTVTTDETLPALKPANLLYATLDSDYSEAYLARRMARPEKPVENIGYEFTADPGLLQQYYRIREEMFISVWGLQHFIGGKEAFDDKSEILVARIKNFCIGGCRMTFSFPDAPQALPMEKSDLSLKTLFPELDLNRNAYFEVSRLAVLPEYQGSVVMLELIRNLIINTVANKARYAFTLSPLPLARNYRQSTSVFGLKWNIRTDIKVPDCEEYEGIKMVLSVLDFAPLYADIVRTQSQSAPSDELVELA